MEIGGIRNGNMRGFTYQPFKIDLQSFKPTLMLENAYNQAQHLLRNIEQVLPARVAALDQKPL